jgi:sulfur transfer protein SufE
MTTGLPGPLQEILDGLGGLADRGDRIRSLVSFAEAYSGPDPSAGHRPMDQAHLVPGCEIDIYAWVDVDSDGNVTLDFAVLNPQGVSAKALAVILKRGLEGQPLSSVALVPDDLISRLFGGEVSVGTTIGLTNMVRLVKALAERLEPTEPGTG